VANRTLAAGDLAVHAATLAAGTEDVVTFAEADDYVLLVHPGTSAPVYVSHKTVTVGDADSRVVFPGFALDLGPQAAEAAVHVISAEAATYSVERA